MVDIHSHTIYSDGSFSVKEIMEEAERVGLSLLSITDHNTIQAYQELKKTNIRSLFSGSIIPGIEITTTYMGETIEVLGYGFDLEVMQRFLDSNILAFEEKQMKEYELVKNQYKKIGVIFDENNIKFDSKKESCRVAFFNEIKRYPKNYKFFLNDESIKTASAFTRNEVYNPKSPLYVDESSLFPSLEKSIDMIHQSGGIAFLAHTYAYSPNIANELLNIINNYAFDGLECFYTTFTDEQSNYLVQLCEKKQMFMSGGSDFHGTRKTNYNLGTGFGNLNINESVVQNWVNKYIPNFCKEENNNGKGISSTNFFDFCEKGYEYLKEVLTTDNVSDYIQKELVLDVLLNRIPELKDMIGFEHKHPHHHLDVWKHTMLALDISPNDFDIRLVLLLHDIGKPHCFQEGEVRHFKGHAKVSSQMAFNILKRFEFDEDKINEICYLIELHDTPITEDDILNNRNLTMKRFMIQCCDALAHNPQKLEKRIAYLNSISELMNNEEEKMAYRTLIKKYHSN